MLDGLDILCVGGSGDLGLALCRDLVGRGARVTATYRTRPAGLQALRAELGRTLRLHALDVTSYEDCRNLGDQLSDENAVPKVLVYNAGVVDDVPVLGMSDEAWDRVMAVNLKGALNVIRAVVKHMSRSRGGKIFLVSSVAGTRGGRGQGNYAASKAGLEALGRSLAAELARKEILVNMIAPGVIESAMTESVMALAKDKVLGHVTLGRLGRPAEVASFIAHLCAPDMTYFTGQTFHVDGGFKL